MTYAEKRLFKAQTALRYAEEGFKASAAAAADILKEGNIDIIPPALEALALEYETLEEAREEVKFSERLCDREESHHEAV